MSTKPELASIKQSDKTVIDVVNPFKSKSEIPQLVIIETQGEFKCASGADINMESPKVNPRLPQMFLKFSFHFSFELSFDSLIFQLGVITKNLKGDMKTGTEKDAVYEFQYNGKLLATFLWFKRS